MCFPAISQDEEGLKRLFKQVSLPAASRVTSRLKRRARSTGRRAGYSLSHAFGAAFDNPGFVVAFVTVSGATESDAALSGSYAGWRRGKRGQGCAAMGCPAPTVPPREIVQLTCALPTNQADPKSKADLSQGH